MASHQNFESKEKKEKNVKDLTKRRESKSKETQILGKSERIQEGLNLWVGYWRANPQRFVDEYLGIRPFGAFQRILLYMMFQSNYFLWWASRGLGKSYLTAVYCVVRCILYPDTKICIAAGTKSQSLNIISEKIQGFYDNSANLRREICELRTSITDPVVKFHNGSWIKIVAATDNARSARANVIIVDEFRMVDLEIIQKVLRKFLTSRRRPGFLDKDEYKGKTELQEPNTEIYLSSAWLKSHWSWDRFNAFKDQMLKGGKYFTCGLPYQMGIKYGVIDKERVVDEMMESDFDSVAFAMEMECIPFGESEKSYFKFEELSKTRINQSPFIPITDEEFAKYKGDRRKTTFFKKKEVGEIRVLGCDVSLMAGQKNDATSITLVRCIPQGEYYLKMVDYTENLEGAHTDVQALRLKQLFYDLDCDYCVIDCLGNGLSIYDAVVKATIDPARGVTYPAWTSFSDENMASRCTDENAVPLVYSMKVAGANAQFINHDMASYTKTQFARKRIRLLCNEVEAREYLNKTYKYNLLSPEEKVEMINPYFNTSRLISEMINLEMTVASGYIKLKEPSGHRKDRYSSLSYALYYVKELELELATPRIEDEFAHLMQYTFF